MREWTKVIDHRADMAKEKGRDNMRVGKIRIALLALLCAGGMAATAAAQPREELPLIDDTQIVGYYTVLNEEFSLLATGNGVIWSLDPDPQDWGVFEDFQVYGSEDAFLILHEEGSALYFERQDWKEPALNGGIYYAAYDNFVGNEEEEEFDEGSQILVNGCIFDNNYQVVLRQPLAAFFHINEAGEQVMPGAEEAEAERAVAEEAEAEDAGAEEAETEDAE